MTKAVWKYRLPIADTIQLSLPFGAKPLCVMVQYDEICMWVLVDPDCSPITHKFYMRGTGHPLTGAEGPYIGSVQLNGGALVFHLFGERAL